MIIAAACAVLTACEPSDQGGVTPSFNGIKEVILHPGASAAVPVYDCWAGFSATIDNAAIANVSAENGQVIIKSKENAAGNALITVKNNEGGSSANIYLVVLNENMTMGWSISERKYMVKAASNVAEIEADIQSR